MTRLAVVLLCTACAPSVWVVDRIEPTPTGPVAVLVSDAGAPDRIVALDHLPAVAEGDVLRGGRVDSAETARRLRDGHRRLCGWLSSPDLTPHQQAAYSRACAQ